MTNAKEWAVNQLPVPGIHARLNHYSGLRGAVKLGSQRAVLQFSRRGREVLPSQGRQFGFTMPGSF
jgi:hypothetical protein